MNTIRVPPLRSLADVLRQKQDLLTERWMRAVVDDENVVRSDDLTRAQLADHLPVIFDEICFALEAQDLDAVEPAIRRNARIHGKWRWKQGYQIGELVRELELFRQMLTGAVADFAQAHDYFTRSHEERARHLIGEAISAVTLTSIEEVVRERDRKIDEYTGKLERANHELVLKQNLVSDLHESRMQITRSVAHDLRNFLNVFATALQLVQRAPTKAGTALALAHRQATDMKQLVDELVEYSVAIADTDSVSVEWVDLRELFDELALASRAAIEEKGLHLVQVFDEQLSTVSTNRLKLKQIALNLISNATKYTNAGQVELGMSRKGLDHWCLRVADTGIGIASADADRVFEEFERAADEDTPGVGLGLAIVRELCRNLKGQLSFSSKVGQGSAFEIRFPVQMVDGASETKK
jgi:signal transduction histidine kinase